MTEELGGVFDADGVRGTLEGPAEGEGDGRARVRLADDVRLLLPTGELVRREDGALVFRGSFEEMAAAARVREWKEGGPACRRPSRSCRSLRKSCASANAWSRPAACASRRM